MKYLLVVLPFVLGLACASASELYITIGYCSSSSQGNVAVVRAAAPGGANSSVSYNVVSSSVMPEELSFGCDILQDPVVLRKKDASSLYLMFGSTGANMLELDLKSGKPTKTLPNKSAFFAGFVNAEPVGSGFIGVTPTVEESGFCNDGCMGFGTLGSSGVFGKLSDLPFKAATDDVQYYDEATGMYYFQASHDLRASPCAPAPYLNCMLAINAKTGAMQASTYTNYTAYHMDPRSEPSSVRAFVSGFENECENQGGDESFAFASIDVTKGGAISSRVCADKRITIHEASWISSFSQDGKRFATASGNAEAGSGQVVVFDTSSGAAILQDDLAQLKDLLSPYMGVFNVWSVDYIE